MPRDEAASGNTLRGARMTASGKVAPRHFERLDRSLWAVIDLWYAAGTKCQNFKRARLGFKAVIRWVMVERTHCPAADEK
ncbi:hypothetical protein ACOI1H_18740 [Loktanella sp. DJP18]|uniref:hypothetical protein n=1 Tax=Loktanella sp. DJP18 TaxID=3409788 RepID=UPI003BB7B8FC